MNGTHIGSNNWAVSGAHSVSGKPVIANDPHLAFSAPGKWYIVNIRAGKWNASGVTLPGIPEMVIGKNENIVWALTNVMADQTDFYIETVNKEKTHYKVDTAWKPLKKMEYTIKVKDSSDVRLEVWETHHGPVISGVHLFSNLRKVENNAPFISMRWTGNDVSDEYYAMYQINRARDWSAFRQGVKYFTTPGQNFLYADVQGNIGFICDSKIPLRGAGNPNFAMDGADTRNDWTGYVPYETMPYVFNPPEGKLATANNNVTPSFPHYITGVWEPTSRIDRINEMLSLQDKFSPADFKRMQMDFFSPYAREITAHLLAAFKDVKITDPNLKRAVKLLSEWDSDFLPELPAPAIYAAFFKHLLLNTFRDELGGELFNQYCMIANVPYRAIQRMLTDNAYPLFDDVTSANKKETRDDIIRKSMGNALTELETAMGKDIHAWRWGKIHHVTFKHFFHGTSSVLDNFIDIGPAEIGGDGTTVFNTEYPLNEYHSEVNRLQTTPYENILGPSMRFICDLSTPDQFEIVLPTGQSGNILSPHYSDMTEHWLRGGYYTLRVSAEAGRKNRDKLTLRPGG
jgi:penicillin amidase